MKQTSPSFRSRSRLVSPPPASSISARAVKFFLRARPVGRGQRLFNGYLHAASRKPRRRARRSHPAARGDGERRRRARARQPVANAKGDEPRRERRGASVTARSSPRASTAGVSPRPSRSEISTRFDEDDAMLDERERVRRQLALETKRRRELFEKKAKARAALEEEMVRISRRSPRVPSSAPRSIPFFS